MTGVTDEERVAKTMDKLSVNFGVEILTLVKGYVSTEVDARLSFDTEATLERARNIIALYEAAGKEAETFLLWTFFFGAQVLKKRVEMRVIRTIENGYDSKLSLKTALCWLSCSW